MAVRYSAADPSEFPDKSKFVDYHESGALASPPEAAAKGEWMHQCRAFGARLTIAV